MQVHLVKHKFGIEYCYFLDREYEYWAKDFSCDLGQVFSYTLKTYWCNQDKWFYDFEALGDGQRTGKRRRQIAPSGLFNLKPSSSDEVVTACLNALRHDRVFNTQYPIPTLAICDPDYAPHGWGWNGPAWLQVNYFVITGLLNVQQYEAAFDLWQRTRSLIMHEGKPHSYELYDPVSGTGMGCPDYSWQAMVNHLIVRHFAGVGSYYLRPYLPKGMNRLSVSNLPGVIKSISLKRTANGGKIDIEISPEVVRSGGRTINSIWLGAFEDVRSVSINGQALLEEYSDYKVWDIPSSFVNQKHWEIIIECR